MLPQQSAGIKANSTAMKFTPFSLTYFKALMKALYSLFIFISVLDNGQKKKDFLLNPSFLIIF